MKQVNLLFLGLFILLINTDILLAQSRRKIFMYNEYYNKEQVDFVKKNNIGGVYLIYQNFFINSKTSRLDKSALKSYLDSSIPNKYAVGYAILDWEGEAFSILKGTTKVSNNKYNEVIERYLEALLYAKSLRPKMKWSYYNIIPSRYPEVTPNTKLQERKLILLLNKLDFLTPSLYLRDDRSRGDARKVDRYLTTNVKHSIEQGKLLNIPVLPFVWHRYNDRSRSNYKMNLLDFKWYIERVLTISNEGRKVDGVIWWNSESFIYRNRNKNRSYLSEYKGITNPKKYQMDMLSQYYSVIKDLTY